MSDLDKELERAAAAVDVPAPAARPEPAPTPPARKKGNLGLLIGLLVMAGAILTLVFTSFKGSAMYSKGVDELIREKDKYSGSDRAVRVQGVLVKGTLVHRDEPCEYRFEMQSKDVVLPVRFAQCIVPDTFRDMPGMDVMVTVEGKLSGAGHFEASSIFAKCPSKYEMKEMQKGGQKAPHAAQMAQAL
ncbi:MAG TPA: cytochrome c maturation protein CcmE [Polyangiaceae bacterium]|nr:cytochrome c maturation protein CcmE [Polyangiaceae bacterium]